MTLRIRFLLFTSLLCASLARPDFARAAEYHSLLDGLFGIEAKGEKEEVFETDRDSFTPATTVVPESRLMVESAVSFIDNRETPETYSFPELLFRYGANEWLELRFLTSYDIGGESTEISGAGSKPRSPSEHGEEEFGTDISDSAKVEYGFKAALTSQSDWIPESALMVVGVTPTSGEETASSMVATYVAGWDFENGMVWDSSIRYAVTGDDESTWQWAPSSVLKIPVGEVGDAHIEYFGIFTHGPEGETDKQYISPGYHFEICEDVELGLRVGWGITEDAANFFSNFGIGILF